MRPVANDAAISVSEQDDGAYGVELHARGRTHRYRVTVPVGFGARLGRPAADPLELVRLSFEFLLEREPAGSILERFDLDVISRYFPDYESVLSERFPQMP